MIFFGKLFLPTTYRIEENLHLFKDVRQASIWLDKNIHWSREGPGTAKPWSKTLIHRQLFFYAKRLTIPKKSCCPRLSLFAFMYSNLCKCLVKLTQLLVTPSSFEDHDNCQVAETSNVKRKSLQHCADVPGLRRTGYTSTRWLSSTNNDLRDGFSIAFVCWRQNPQ